MFAANITREEAQLRSTLIKAQSYEVTVDFAGRDGQGALLEAPDQFFYSRTVATFEGLKDGDSYVNLIAERVLSASLDGQALDADAFDGEHLAFAVTPGVHTLVVESIMRYSHTGEGTHRFTDPVDDRTYLYTQFESADARRMYACFDQPDQKATFQLTAIAPASWTVVSNAPEVTPEPLEGGVARWVFAPTQRISTYITAVCAGEFHVVRDTYTGAYGERALSIAVRQSLKDALDADKIFETTKRGFDFFEETFARPYPFEDYAQIFVPEYNFGAMENAGCVTFRDEYIFRSRQTAATYESRDNTILHEMAHMWFGDLVTMTWWDDLWLNESFAEWASHFAQQGIAAKHDTGEDPWATFTNQRKTWAYRQDQLPTTHPIAADMYDLEAVELNFDGITYAKGASTVRQLVAFVGVDKFVAGLREYFNKHAYANTQLSDLLAELEAASGRDLSRFTSEWLQTSGVTVMAAEFDTDEGGAFTRFAVRQTPANPDYPTLRQHRMAIGLYTLTDGGLERTQRVELDVDGELTAVPDLVGVAQPDLVLLNDDDLTYAKIRFDARSLATLVGHLADLPTALTRALCWGAAWDMCRDAQMSASDYADLVLGAVAGEADMTAVQATLAQARMAIDYYAPAEQRAAIADRFRSGVFALVKDAEPGSDAQLAFARAAALAITAEDGADVVAGWLEGRDVPQGLTVDADLRWRFLTQLARVGAVDEAAIAAEEQKDGSATGAEKAAGARSAMPSAQAKAHAWKRATVDQTPNETQFQICASFVQLDQDAVLEPYKEEFLATATQMARGENGWADKSSHIRQNVLNFLFPAPLADEAYLERCEATLEQVKSNEFVARLLNERIDNARRALRCQRAAQRD